MKLQCTGCETVCTIETRKPVKLDKLETWCWIVEGDGSIPITLQQVKRRGE